MVRDEELTRLKRYAEGMGLRVRMLDRPNADTAASWALDGSEITIFTNNNDSKTEILLSFIHELGHAKWYAHEKDRKPDLKFEEAIDRQNLFDEDLNGKPAPKHLRKKILDVETAGADWWLSIYKETNMQFPLWKLYSAKEFDVWQYEVFYETGFFPTSKEAKLKFKEINAKYRDKKYE